MQCLWRVPLILFQINRVTIGLRWRSEGLHETCSPEQGRYTGQLQNFLYDALRCIRCADAQRSLPLVNPLRWHNGRRRCKWPWLPLVVSSFDAVLTPQLSFLETHLRSHRSSSASGCTGLTDLKILALLKLHYSRFYETRDSQSTASASNFGAAWSSKAVATGSQYYLRTKASWMMSFIRIQASYKK